MNGHWGTGASAASPLPNLSPQARRVCDEARAAAAWLWVQSEIAGAFERFSKDLLAIHGRGLNAVTVLDTCRQKNATGKPDNEGSENVSDGGGARDALNSLLLLCSEAGAEAERFSSALKVGVVKPLEDALHVFATAADASDSPDAANTQVPSEFAGSGDVQKAARRLQLAEEELTKAEASLQELRALFGEAVNSSLEQKATQRICRASRLKVAAQEALQQALAAEAAKRRQCPTSSAPRTFGSVELKGSARLLKAGNDCAWAQAGGVSTEEHQRRVSLAVLQSMRAASKAALTSQQRSTGYVLHYVRDMQLFAAAEAAAASASGSFTGDAGQDMIAPGAAEELISQLYKQANGGPDTSQQRTTEATLRNLLLHQEKQLQETLNERDELRLKSEGLQKEIQSKQKELEELKKQREEDALAVSLSPKERRQKVRKQVTINLGESDEENTWQESQSLYQGGVRGELHGRAERALQLSAVKAGSAEGPLRESPDNSPPAAGQSNTKEPIEMIWVDVQLKYEAFLISLRSLPLSNMSLDSTKPTDEQRKEQQWSSDRGEVSGLSSSLASRPVGASNEVTAHDVHWRDPAFAACLAEAIASAADAALPSFLVRCCRRAAAAASLASPANSTAPRIHRTGRMSVQQVQDRILSSRRQQQQQQESTGGISSGPLEWKESDLQMLAYEVLLLTSYHHSQYSAAAALLVDEEAHLLSSSSNQGASLEAQSLSGATAAATGSRQMRRPRKSLARAMSLRLGAAIGSEAEDQQQEQQTCEGQAELNAMGDALMHQQQHQGPNAPPVLPRRPRKSLARAMSLKLGSVNTASLETQQQHQQQHQLQQGDGTAGGCVTDVSGFPDSNFAASADLLGPCHPFSLPLEEWQRRIEAGNFPKGPLSHRSVIPTRQRLQTAIQWMSPSPILQQSNENVLVQLLQLARVSFDLPSSSSNKLLSLLTPISNSGFGPGCGTCIHPCDLRYRVFRLMESWRVALWPAASASKALPRKQQQQQQQRQHQRGRFFHGAAAAAIGKLDTSHGVRGALRRRAGDLMSAGDKETVEGRRSSAKAFGEHRGSSPGGGHGTQQRKQQLAGDLGPPALLQLPQERRRSKRGSASSTAAATTVAGATAVVHYPPAPETEAQNHQDPVFRSFVERQLQLLYAAALTRCIRLLKFLLPQGGGRAPAAAAAAAGLEGEEGLSGCDVVYPLPGSPWRPLQVQQLYAREKSRSDEEAFLYFLRSLLLCQGETSDSQTSPHAPAFLLYSKEETAAAIAAAAQLQLLPLRLLCCFYHIFAYIFALQQLHRRQLWGDEEASVGIEEVSILVTDYSAASAGTGEAEAPLTWEVRTEHRDRGGLQLLQLLEHSMSQAASLDSALRCTLAARSNNNPTLKRLSTVDFTVSNGDIQTSPQQPRRQLSLKPVRNLLEVPDTRSDCGEMTEDSDASGVWGSDVEAAGKGRGASTHQGEPAGPLQGALRSAFRRPTLKALRRRTLRTLEGGATATGAATAAARMLDGAEQRQLLCLPREVQLCAYWCMDVPLLLSLLLLLSRCCADSTSTNGLQLDAPSLVQGLLLVAHAAQVGTDPTCPSADEPTSTSNSALQLLKATRAGSGFPGISLDSVSLLVAACVWATSSNSSPSSHEVQQQQQQQQQQHLTPPPAGSAELTDMTVQKHEVAQSSAHTSPNRPDCSLTAEQQQQQRLIQQLMSVTQSIVQPARVEVVSTALELVSDFGTFLKKPSAGIDETADEVGWVFGNVQETDDRELETSAAIVAPVAAAAVHAEGSPGDSVSASGGNNIAPTSPRSGARVAGSATGYTVVLRKPDKGTDGKPTAAARIDSISSGLDLMELSRVRGERLLLSLRSSLLERDEEGTEKEGALSAQPIPTFSGFLTNRLWLGADWWVARNSSNRGRGEQHRALRKSQWASCCYGLSALLPSRVELQQQEIAALQLLGSDFLLQLQQQLQDYRRHFEPQGLHLALALWRSVVQRLLLLPQAQQQQQREITVGGRGQTAGGRAYGICSEVPEEWVRRTRDVLQRAVDNGVGLHEASTQAQDREGTPDREVNGVAADNSWVWMLHRLVQGPTALHDMLRCFVYRSLSAAAGRLLGRHVLRLVQIANGEKGAFRDAAARDMNAVEEQEVEAGERATSGAEEEAEEDEILSALAKGIDRFLSHVHSELLLYSFIFSPLLPLRGEHALLVLAAAKSVLLSVISLVSRCAERAVQNPERRGLPAKGGRDVLAALSAFERLADELCFGGVLCVTFSSDKEALQRGLVSALAPRFFASFSLHLSDLTDILSQAFLRDVFLPANPPHSVYSENAIDGWCCIYGVVEAALDSFLPLRWLIPRLLQFLSELFASLCRSLTDPCISQNEGPGAWGGRPMLPLLALRQLQQTCFMSLLDIRGRKAAFAECPLVVHFLALQRTSEEHSRKHRRKSKGWKGRMTQLVGGWEDGNPQQGLARAGSAYLSGVEDDNSGDSTDHQGTSAHQPPKGTTGRPTEDDKGRSRSVFRLLFGQNDSRESSITRGGQARSDADAAGRASAGLRPFIQGLDRLCPTVTQLLAAVDTLTDWEAARQKTALTAGQRPTSGLQRWLVRLHIVELYLQRLPGLREKLVNEAKKRIVRRCPRDVEVVQHLRKLPGRGDNAGSNGVTQTPARDPLQLLQLEEFKEVNAAVDNAIEAVTQKFQETAKELCSLAAAHLIYYELQGDIFGNMYAGEDAFSGMTLSRLLQAFPNTVEAFFCAAPLEWQDELASAVIRSLVEAWCLLLLEWGYGGHCYERDELEVLEADLNCLRQYVSENEITLEDGEDMLDRVSDFLVMLDADGSCLAGAEFLAKQQDSPNFEPSVDPTEKNRRSTVCHGRPSQTTAIPISTDVTGDNETPPRSRHKGHEETEAGERSTGRRHRSKSKGWGGVGRWVRGVYGGSSTHTHKHHSRTSGKAAHDRDDADAARPHESPRRSLRFAM